jgi:hypothetical protein
LRPWLHPAAATQLRGKPGSVRGGQSSRHTPYAVPSRSMKRQGGSRVFECKAKWQDGGRHTECACYFADGTAQRGSLISGRHIECGSLLCLSRQARAGLSSAAIVRVFAGIRRDGSQNLARSIRQTFGDSRYTTNMAIEAPLQSPKTDAWQIAEWRPRWPASSRKLAIFNAQRIQEPRRPR